jgi:hypothetical protein
VNPKRHGLMIVDGLHQIESESTVVLLVFVLGLTFFYRKSRRHYHYYGIKPMGGSEINNHPSSVAAPSTWHMQSMDSFIHENRSIVAVFYKTGPDSVSWDDRFLVKP